MNDFTDEKRDSMLRKVRSLLERANHDGTPPHEADSARTMAESLMFKYRLDEAMAVHSGALSVTPVWKKLDLVVNDSEFANFYYQLAGVVMQHVGAKGVTGWREMEDGRMMTTLEWVGYSSDLSYGDMLMTACMVEFGKRLEPRYDPNLSDRDNIYNMRSAGMERKRIAKIIYGDWDTENEMKTKNRRVTKEFILACEERGEDSSLLLGRGNNVKTYRESFARGFVSTFHTRLIRLRQANVDKDGGGLVLVDRFERVTEAYYTKFPQYRPKAEGEKIWNDPREECDNCKKSKSGYCRAHGYLKPSNATVRVAHNRAAHSRGGAAAALVDLGSGSAGQGRVQNGERTAIGG